MVRVPAPGLEFECFRIAYGGLGRLAGRIVGVGTRPSQGWTIRGRVPRVGRRIAAAFPGPHQRDRLAFLGHRLVGGEPTATFERRCLVQPALALETVHGPLDGLDRGRPGTEGDRGCDQIGVRKHRVALGEMDQVQFTASRAGSAFAA